MAVSKISGVTLVLLVIAVANAMATQGAAAVECSQVQADLQPCLAYLKAGGEPGQLCCDGLKRLKTILPTTADRQAACACIKAAAAKLPTTIDVNAAQLPEKCDTPIGFPVSRTIDCNSVN